MLHILGGLHYGVGIRRIRPEAIALKLSLNAWAAQYATSSTTVVVFMPLTAVVVAVVVLFCLYYR